MSSFTCDKCEVLNIDSGRDGYTQGCLHWPPQRTGIYECIVKREGLNDLNQRVHYDAKKQKWSLATSENIKHWKVNPHL